MAACDDAASLAHFVRRAAEDGGDGIDRHVAGKRGNAQCQQNGSIHGEDIAHCVGRRYGAIGVGIVHDGRKEIDRLHDCLVGAHAKDSCIVAGLQSDEEVGMRIGHERKQRLREPVGPHLGGASRAGCQFGEALTFGIGNHRVSRFELRAFRPDIDSR